MPLSRLTISDRPDRRTNGRRPLSATSRSSRHPSPAGTAGTSGGRRNRSLPRSGSGALTVNLTPSARSRRRRRATAAAAGVDADRSVQVLNKNNLPLTLALHVDFLEKNHIHQTGIAHKTLLRKCQKRLDTRHNKHVIAQWDYQHSRRVPFPEIKLPLTLKRITSSDGIKGIWNTLQTHNQLISRATKTMSSYLPEHVMKMRARKKRNRDIILNNHRLAARADRKYQASKSSGGRKGGIRRQRRRPGSAKPVRKVSARQRKEWEFQDQVVAETLRMYAGLDNSAVGRSDRDDDPSPSLASSGGQRGPAGLSVKYLKGSVRASGPKPLPGRLRPRSANDANRRREIGSSAVFSPFPVYRASPRAASASQSRSSPSSAPHRRPHSAGPSRLRDRRRSKRRAARGHGAQPTILTPQGVREGDSGNGVKSNSGVSMERWVNNLGEAEERTAGVDLLRSEHKKDWIGVKRAALGSALAETNLLDTPKKVEVASQLLEELVLEDK